MNFIYVNFGYRFLSRSVSTAAHAPFHSPSRIRDLLLGASRPSRACPHEPGRARPQTRQTPDLCVGGGASKNPPGFFADSRLVPGLRNDRDKVRRPSGTAPVLVVGSFAALNRARLGPSRYGARQSGTRASVRSAYGPRPLSGAGGASGMRSSRPVRNTAASSAAAASRTRLR